MEKLDFLVRFWDLRARYESQGSPLTRQERLELLSLLQLLATEPEPPSLEALDPSRRGLPAQVTAGSGFLAGEIKELSADRLVVGAIEPLPLGHRTIVYVADAVSGVEYAIPTVVVWTRDGEPCLIGLAPDGVPTRAEFTARATGVYRSPFGVRHAGKSVQA